MKAIQASILSLLTIGTFVFFAACPTTTGDIDEEDMKELRFEYTIDGYTAYVFADWEGPSFHEYNYSGGD